MLTPAKLAAALDISERQVHRLTSAGMPCVPVGARGKRYDLEECKNWLKDNHTCLSNQQKPEAGRSVSASAVNAFTAAYRRAHLRVKPSSSKPNSDQPSQEVERRLSLVTQD